MSCNHWAGTIVWRKMQSGGTRRRMTKSTGCMRRNGKKENTDMASACVQKSAVKAGKSIVPVRNKADCNAQVCQRTTYALG